MNISLHANQICIYLGFSKFVKTRGKVINDAICCSRKGNSTEKKNNQHYIGEQGSEVDHLQSTIRWHIRGHTWYSFLY